MTKRDLFFRGIAWIIVGVFMLGMAALQAWYWWIALTAE